MEAFTAALQAECYAVNTQCSYSTGVRSFVSFCIAGRRRNFLEEMLPASDEVLAKWVVFMVTDQLVKPSTAKQCTLLVYVPSTSSSSLSGLLSGRGGLSGQLCRAAGRGGTPLPSR